MASLRAVSVLLMTSLAVVQGAGVHSIYLSRVFPAPGQLGLFVANADGSGEHPLLAEAGGLDYDATWSRTGDWIAFTSERSGSADLYRVRPDGRDLERLTDNASYDDQAAFSPDGTRLVFVTTRAGGTADLWTMDVATRREQPLTAGDGGDFRPSWSPDGQWIAFSSDRTAGLPFSRGRWEALHVVDVYVIHPDGTGLKRLSTHGGFCGSPKWSDDSARVIAYCMSAQETIDFRWSAGTPDGTTGLMTFDVATGQSSPVAAGPGVKISPAFLPGGQIGFVRKDKAAAGIYYTGGTSGPKGTIQSASWAPDGARVVFHKVLPAPANVVTTKLWSRLPSYELRLAGVQASFNRTGDRLVMADFVPTPGTNHLLIAEAASSKTTVLFHDAARSALGPQWSPAGDMVIFGVGHFGAFFNDFHDTFFSKPDRVDGGAQVGLINADGTGFREVTSGPNNNSFPSMSPDGRRFVYRTFGLEDNGLRIMDLQTKAVTTLTDGYDNFPLWSPRGDLIMFSRRVNDDYEIYSIKPDGTGLKRLTSSPGNDAHQGWSPDGEHIVFATSRMGFKDEAIYTNAPQPYGEIFVMRADGSDLEQLTDNQWEEGAPAWQPTR
jgi:Tol biopolymer transport system component